MCRVFGVSRSQYYARLKVGATKRQREDHALLVDIKAAFDASDRTYGAGRIGQDLREQGTRVGKNRIWRLMKQNGLRVKTTKRFKVTTNSDHKRPVAPNLVQRHFSAEAPDRLWTGDITYIWTAEGWLYLAVVLDVFSRRIVGWSMDKRMTDSLDLAYRVGKHRACEVVCLWRAVYYYKSVKKADRPLRQRIREIAAVRVRYGVLRLHVLLRPGSWFVIQRAFAGLIVTATPKTTARVAPKKFDL